MIKLDIVNAVVSKTDVSRTKAEQAVETVFEAMKNALGRGDRIELRRFGVFNVKPRKTGIGRNPRTGPGSEHSAGQSGALQARQGTSDASELRNPESEKPKYRLLRCARSVSLAPAHPNTW